jgi:hypothetical protein
MRRIAWSACVSAAFALSGCGLISSDVTNFDLTLPAKSFTVDTTSWGLTNVGTFTSTDCSANQGVCAAAAQQACNQGQCFGSCDSGTQTCDLKVLVSLWQAVDLVAEKPELATINNQPLVGVSIDKLEYQVTENSLNVATPPMSMYIAPATVMAPGDPQAQLIATIPPIPAGAIQPLMPVTLTADGKAQLAKFMGDYKTPFNIIVGAQIDVKMGDVVPMGRLGAKVLVTAHASLGG